MQDLLPKVSVIIPCYNSQETIAACIRGLLDQDYPSYEIIAVDDNSGDATVEILESIPGIRLIRNNKNLGPAYSRNRAIEEASGQIILLIDSDSAIDDRSLISKHISSHRDPSVHIIGGGVEGIGSGYVARTDRYVHWFLNIPNSDNKTGTHILTNNMSLKKHVFDSLGGFNNQLRTGEDTDFCERALKAGYRLGLATDAVIKHHDRQGFGEFIRYFYLTGLDRVPARRIKRHRYWFLLPGGFISSCFYCLPLAFLLTLQVVFAWFRYDKRVFFYLPLIFMGRLALAFGVVSYYFRNGHLMQNVRS